MADNGNSSSGPEEISPEARQFMKDAVADPEWFRRTTGYALEGESSIDRLENLREIVTRIPGDTPMERARALMTTQPVSQAYLASLHEDASKLTEVETALGELADANERLAAEKQTLTDRVVRAETALQKAQAQYARDARVAEALAGAELPAPQGYNDEIEPEQAQLLLLTEKHRVPEATVPGSSSADDELPFADIFDSDAVPADLGRHEADSVGQEPMTHDQLYAWEEQLKAQQEALDDRDANWKGVEMEARDLAAKRFGELLRDSRTGTLVPDAARVIIDDTEDASLEICTASEADMVLLEPLEGEMTPLEYEQEIADLSNRLGFEVAASAERDVHIKELDKENRDLARRWADLDEKYVAETKAGQALEGELAEERQTSSERKERLDELSGQHLELTTTCEATKSKLDGRETLLMFLYKEVEEVLKGLAPKQRSPISLVFVSCDTPDPEELLDKARGDFETANEELVELREYRDSTFQTVESLKAENERLALYEGEVVALTAELEGEKAERASTIAEVDRLEDELVAAGKRTEELEQRLDKLEVEKKQASEWTKADYAVQIEAAGFSGEVAQRIVTPVMLRVKSGTSPVDALMECANAYVEKDISERKAAFESARKAHDAHYVKRVDNLKGAQNLTEDRSSLVGVALVLTSNYNSKTGNPAEALYERHTVYEKGMADVHERFKDHRFITWLKTRLRRKDVVRGESNGNQYIAVKICETEESERPIAYFCAFYGEDVNITENLTKGVVGSLTATIRTQFSLQMRMKNDLDYAQKEYPAMLDKLIEHTTI